MSSMTAALVPDATQMRRYLERGLSQQQIADEWEKDSNNRVTRAAIGMAINRYGLKSSTERDRYDDLLPWSIKPEHRQHRDAKHLRYESRRRRGKSLSEGELRRLENWKLALRDAGAVVYYEPNTDQGWHWVPREPQDDDLIRRPEA